MNKPDPEISPCYYCTEETGRYINCHSTCERWAKAQIKRAAEKKAKHDFNFQHQPFLTEALKDRTIKNQTKYKRQYIRAFDKMLKDFKNPPENWTDGEAVMDWWLGKKPKSKELEGQINIFEQEILEEIKNG